MCVCVCGCVCVGVCVWVCEREIIQEAKEQEGARF